MNYIKVSIILPFKRTADIKNYEPILYGLRNYLYRLGCFDIDWVWSDIKISDLRMSDLYIDLSSTFKYKPTASRVKSSKYISIPFMELNLGNSKLTAMLEETITTLYTKPSILRKAPIPELYHISLNSRLPFILHPRQSEDTSEDNVDIENDPLLAEDLPPRISFSSSIEGCFRAIYPNILDMVEEANGRDLVFYVYRLAPKPFRANYMSPDILTEKKKIHDACFTSEYCFFKNVVIRKLAMIAVSIGENPRANKITYMMHGGPLRDSDDTGWAPDMHYKIVERYNDRHIQIDKYDLNRRRP